MPQAPTVDLPKRLPLVIQPENRDESSLKDAKILNAYVEHNAQTDEYWIFKRPGLLQYGVTQTGAGRGVWNWQGNIYSIFGTTLYKDGVSVGTVDGTGGVYRFGSSNTAANGKAYLVLNNGVKGYTYDGTTLTQQSGVNFPGNSYTLGLVKGVAYLDGSTYVLDTAANIHGCDILAGRNRPDLWTDTTNLLGAQIEPDAGVTIGKALVYVVVLKQWSAEIFYDALNTTASPLGPVQGAKVGYGIINADSFQELDGVLFWLATNRSSAVQVLMLENLKASIVSTKPIERLLGEADFTSLASFAIKYEGHRFYGVTSKVGNFTLVYDMTDKMWSQWTDVNGNYWPIVAGTYLTGSGRVLQHETNGKLYTMDSAYTSDDGSLITVDLYTPNFDGGVRKIKNMKMMRFIGDQTPGSVLQVRTNDYDYAADKWTQFRRVDMSRKDPFLTDCGSFRRRATHIHHACDTRMRLQAVELQLDLGTL